MVWGWTKKIVIGLLLLIVVILGGRAGWNYYKYGDVRGKEYETAENKYKDIEKQLQSGLEKLQKNNIDLWEANEVFKEVNKINFPDDKSVPPKIIETTFKILGIMSDIFKDYTDKVLNNEISLSDLDEEKLNTLVEIKHEAKQIFQTNSRRLQPEEKKQAESRFNFLEEKIAEEQNRRANNERNKDWAVYGFDKVPEFQNDPDLLEKWVSENVFTYGEVKSWLDIGIKPEEYDFVHWIIEIKSQNFFTEELQTRFKTPSWLKDNNKIEDLRKEYEAYLEND